MEEDVNQHSSPDRHHLTSGVDPQSLRLRCAANFPRSPRSALQSEDYGHPGGHLAKAAMDHAFLPFALLTDFEQVAGEQSATGERNTKGVDRESDEERQQE